MIESITIPELDRAADRYSRRDWTELQETLLRKYWLRVPIHLLERHLHHGIPAIDAKADELGLPPRK